MTTAEIDRLLEECREDVDATYMLRQRKALVAAVEQLLAREPAQPAETPAAVVNAEIAEWSVKGEPSEIPAYYASLYTAMARTARSLGYALALHGSMRRDLDVIAVPWTTEAVTADELVSSLMERHMLARGTEREKHKPHGREAYVLAVSGHYYVDLSVMPTAPEPPALWRPGGDVLRGLPFRREPAPAPPVDLMEARRMALAQMAAAANARIDTAMAELETPAPPDEPVEVAEARSVADEIQERYPEPQRTQNERRVIVLLAYADRLRESLRQARESRDVVVERFADFKTAHWKQVETLRAERDQWKGASKLWEENARRRGEELRQAREERDKARMSEGEKRDKMVEAMNEAAALRTELAMLRATDVWETINSQNSEIAGLGASLEATYGVAAGLRDKFATLEARAETEERELKGEAANLRARVDATRTRAEIAERERDTALARVRVLNETLKAWWDRWQEEETLIPRKLYDDTKSALAEAGEGT